MGRATTKQREEAAPLAEDWESWEPEYGPAFKATLSMLDWASLARQVGAGPVASMWPRLGKASR